MGKSVTVSDYMMIWMQRIVKAGVRQSCAEIVMEGLKAIKFNLDHEYDELMEAKEMVKEIHTNE